MLKIEATENRARACTFSTVHGKIRTPVFMNVGTTGAVRGGVSARDLREVGCSVELSNTYHLHLRPGNEVIFRMGGLREFMNFDGPVLTDSGGFQVYSLSKIRKITEQGVTFTSYLDGKRIFMGPEESMQIQSDLASTIAMAFDECIENPAPYEYVNHSVDRTTRWLKRCISKHNELNQKETTINKQQLLFGINQGGTYADIRARHMQDIAELPLDGFAIGGLSVGETAQEMYSMIDAVEPFMPKDKPRYLMGVGTPLNILEAVYRGIDFFDCVLPLRAAQHGNEYTWEGRVSLLNEKYKYDARPISESCSCPACKDFSRAYIRHLLKADERLGMRLCVLHNLYFYNELMRKIREAIITGTYGQFYRKYINILGNKI